MRQLLFGKDAREKLLKGAEIMYNAVATTLGPKGRNVAIAREWGLPLVVHDGVTVAREVMDHDKFASIGINLIRQAAAKTNEEAGDGTTTSTLLAYFLIKYGLEAIDNGKNPMTLREEIEALQKTLVDHIAKISTPKKTHEDLVRVATISADNEHVGKIVAEAIEKVGDDGLVTVDESFTPDTYIEYTKGMQIDKGWTSPWFITNGKTMESVMKNAAVLVLGKKVTAAGEILPLLEIVLRKNKNVVIFGDVGGQALELLIENKRKGQFGVLVVDAPGYADRRDALLEDIALVTGGEVIRDEIGEPMEVVANSFDYNKKVGAAKTVIASRRITVISDGDGTEDVIKERIETLREQKKNEQNKFEVEKIDERLAKISTGVATIFVGAKTDVLRRELEERVKDAIGASRAAVEEGIVPGGGVTFLQLAKQIDLNKDSSDGATILKRVLQEPLNKILINAGESDKAIANVIAAIKEKGGNYGYEMKTGVLGDLIKAGVIDPAKVIRLALENAIEVATSILTNDCLIIIDDDKKDDK